MIEIDFTQQVVTVEPGLPFEEWEIKLITGYDPDKEQESVHRLEGDKRTEIHHEAAARVKGTGITHYVVRERTLKEPGTYELIGSYRRGNPRTFILHIGKTSEEPNFKLTVDAKSSNSHWIVGDQDPTLHKNGTDTNL